MATEAQRKANARYIEKNLEQIAIRVPKGKREEYKKFAEGQGKSLAGLIQELIEREMQNYNVSGQAGTAQQD